MSNENSTIHMLQENGLRATPQRRAVLEVIAAHGGHLTAEDVHREARQLNPRISLATVYRTLATLQQAGLIQHSFSDQGHDRSRFEAAGAPEHFHFTCLSCGRIIEYKSRQVTTIRRELAERHGVTVTQACMCVSGYCQECASRRAGEAVSQPT